MISVASLLSFVGLISMTEMQRFVPWATNIFGLCAVAIMCGLLLALISPRAVWLMGLASTLSVLIFAAFWTYSTWMLAGAVFSLTDPVISNLLILYLLPRSLILFVASSISGILMVISVQSLLPDVEALDKGNSAARSEQDP